MLNPPAILFDFDGTLVDSAPDLVHSINTLREELNLNSLPFYTLRPYATYGARSLLKAGLDLTPEHGEYESRRKRFIEIYAERTLEKTHLFDGVLELLIAIERAGIAWGIVTNKNSRLAEPMIHELMRDRAFNPAVVVCGDTTPTPKPNPAPLLLAAQTINADPHTCWYVGDGESDMKAGVAAGMHTILATYGYIPDINAAKQWGGARHIDAPMDLARMLVA